MDNQVETSLCCAPCTIPKEWCNACLCCYCMTHTQRGIMLNGNWSDFRCCSGMFPCTRCDCVGECPHLCWCLECVICPGCSVSTNRIMMLDRYGKDPHPCDCWLIQCNNCLQICTCFCGDEMVDCARNSRDCPFCGDKVGCACDLLTCCGMGKPSKECMQNMADAFFCCLTSCMLAQTQREINKNENIKQTNDMFRYAIPTNKMYSVSSQSPSPQQM
jgi:hypothetical protein